MNGAAQHVLVTGAAGFVGKALVSRLMRDHAAGTQPLSMLTLVDVEFDVPPAGRVVRQLPGSIADAVMVSRAFDQPVHCVFHLASIPGGVAEQHYELARDVNLHGTLHLLEAARAQTQRGGRLARFVFASTVAVYGSPLPARVDDDTALNPRMTYGAQKLMGEIAVADFSRRGWVDGVSVRLPGVLARPPAKTGQLSAFLSDIIRELGAGHEFTCPMSPQATTWASSVHNIVDNLLHAARVDARLLPPRRALALPTQQFTMDAMVGAIAQVHGQHVRGRVRWAPDERIEALFGRFPPLTTPTADAAGFCHDSDLTTLVRRAVEAV